MEFRLSYGEHFDDSHIKGLALAHSLMYSRPTTRLPRPVDKRLGACVRSTIGSRAEVACRGPAYRASGPRLASAGDSTYQGTLGSVDMPRAQRLHQRLGASVLRAADGRVYLESTASATVRRRSLRSDGLLRRPAFPSATAVGESLARNQTREPRTAAQTIAARTRQFGAARV